MGVIEAEVERGFAVVTRENAGAMALGLMSPDEFKSKLDMMSATLRRLRELKERALTPGEDYDVVPGTKKLTLLKPGAEKLGMVTMLAPAFHVQRITGDGSKGSPFLTYVVTCRLHRGDTAGPVIAEGVGSCNSNEKKYRYRSAERSCPHCGKVGTVIKGKAEYGGGWLCFAKKGGCGAKFPDDDATIVGQLLGDIEHPDPMDLDNTLLKMAKKRAHVDAVLTGTASSGMFTQDIEETITPEQREDERKRLVESIRSLFDARKVPTPERAEHAKRVWGRPVNLGTLSLAELRSLLDKLEDDPTLAELGGAGDLGADE
jgi:hypothetical protein